MDEPFNLESCAVLNLDVYMSMCMHMEDDAAASFKGSTWCIHNVVIIKTMFRTVLVLVLRIVLVQVTVSNYMFHDNQHKLIIASKL